MTINIIKKPNLFQVRRDLLSTERRVMMSAAVNRAATKTLKNIERYQGKKLSKFLKKQCDSYASEILGSKRYAPNLYVYSAINNDFKEGWISENFYYDKIVTQRDGLYSDLGELKVLTSTILKTDLLPDLFYIKNGVFIDSTTFNVITKHEAFRMLFNDKDQVIFKSNSSKQGLGITLLNKSNWSSVDFKDASGVIQKIINQHEIFNEIFPHPGATIRLTTVIDDTGNVSSRAAFLRLGRTSKKSQSTHVMWESNILIGINLATGKLHEFGHTPSLKSMSSHPDTQITFKEITIPNFKKACAEIERLHSQFPFITCIGWDFVINDINEVEVMEWNTGNNAISYHEIVDGPCFADLIELS